MDNVQEMTPLEAVTHLFTCLQLADGRMDFEEREAWADALTAVSYTQLRAHETEAVLVCRLLLENKITLS